MSIHSMAVSMTSVTVSMTARVEKKKSQDVYDEPDNADVQQYVDLFDHVRVSQSLDRLDEDGEAQSYQEDGID